MNLADTGGGDGGVQNLGKPADVILERSLTISLVYISYISDIYWVYLNYIKGVSQRYISGISKVKNRYILAMP